MSLYIHSNLEEFSDCINSIMSQSLLPDELIIVFDGPVENSIVKFVDELIKASKLPVINLKLESNMGLGSALAHGVDVASYPLIARVDTDDISVPDRFCIQHRWLVDHPNVSVIGGQLEEFYHDSEKEHTLIRHVPLTQQQVLEIAKYRNPLNHPTVMFRRKDILQVGNYLPMLWFEDYYLWARLLQRGFKLNNVNEVLVQERADKDYFSRRGGIRYFLREVALARNLKKIGFHNMMQSIAFVGSRLLFRIVPVSVRNFLYQSILRQPPSYRP